MKRKSQSGVALVITLIMLSMVTLMAVVFLAISRSEKASVTVISNQADARLMADAGLARAVSRIGANILATTNPYNYGLLVSTNFINPLGFRSGVSHPTNVSYTYSNGRNLSPADRLQNLVNLQYDPRPPVYIRTNTDPRIAPEFRYYLDLNRNGIAETNGVLPFLGRLPGQFVETNGQPSTTFTPGRTMMGDFIGDPEWIGVLEYPDKPHSDSNRFVGRYAYIAVPEGKTLDINHIHNNVRSSDLELNPLGYLRNHGIGSWELNLAAFLRDLNTNAWRSYIYTLSQSQIQTRGDSFESAAGILGHRYFDQDPKPNRKPWELYRVVDPELYGQRAQLIFATDGLDTYSDGPLLLGQSVLNFDGLPDISSKAWSGSPNPQGYYDIQEFYNTNLNELNILTANPARYPFPRKLLQATDNSNSSYDRYSYYRLLAQLGTDSRPAVSNLLFQPNLVLVPTNKLHLNFRNDYPNGQTNFIPWDPVIDPVGLVDPRDRDFGPRNPIDFFYQAADRLLRSNLTTNSPFARLQVPGFVPRPNFFLGETPVRDEFSLTNIQLYNLSRNAPYYTTNNEYTATTHRALQLAANLYDSVTRRSLGTTNDYPSVFRPTFFKTPTNLIISGYVEERSADFLRSTLPWLSIEEAATKSPVGPVFNNIIGVPFVVGAKKGYPNFNEASLQTVVQVSRKLEFRKNFSGGMITNQMYVLGISNLFGVEAWNSYTQDFQRPITMLVTNRQSIRLLSTLNNGVVVTNMVQRFTSANFSTNRWPGRESVESFVLPIVDNFTLLPNQVYQSLVGTFTTNNVFEPRLDVPQWTLQISNNLQYILVDTTPGYSRVIDFVNLDNLVTEINITDRLMGNRSAGAGGYFSDSRQTGAFSEDSSWLTNRVVLNDPNSPPVGVTNQIGISMGLPFVGAATWRSASGHPMGGLDKERSIQGFANFMRGRSTNLVMQAPYTPSKKIFERRTWQANDPLVHYTAADLTDLALTNSFGVITPPENPVPPSNLGQINERYRPWGGNPRLSGTDLTDFRMSLKDPGVQSSDDWQFPVGKLPNVGAIGRVHRGTPWQTVYLKSTVEDPRVWRNWAGSFGTHPTNDWKALDLFTVAPNDQAAMGLLSVNQTNQAAWSAVLSGVSVLTNSSSNPGRLAGMQFESVFVRPDSQQLQSIVAGINRARQAQPNGVFRTMGDVLATPELTVVSPFLSLNTRAQIERGLTDEAVERIPRQVLSLLKTDEPRMVIYSFGQSLKPAERSLVTLGNYYNICTNYQITGELVTKTVLRFEEAPYKPRTVVESFSILPPQ
ncbi:MAG: pilus assembly PilX N-terminal domain-containing protein [Verrucomicrobia bacterium]|nr:pilus assembly PilX N-terminal domain-containing protein [Verrucomicrobiota bacterium]